MVLEDDAFLVPDALGRFGTLIGSVPGDWAQLYLGGQHKDVPKKTTSPEVLIGTRVYRAHAYAVSAEALPTVIGWLKSMPVGFQRMTDVRFGDGHARRLWPCYCPPKWMAGQAAGFSDISGYDTPERIW